MSRIGITIAGHPGSGSTTLGKGIARTLGWPKPYYSGGVVRWLAEKMEKEGREAFLEKSDPDIIREITDALKSGEVPERPRISEEYRTFPARLDYLVDTIQAKLMEELSNGVHEGRVAWFFAKKLHREGRALDKTFLHILCRVHPSVGAERQLRRPENIGKSVAQVRSETKKRLRWERQRYLDLYGINNPLHPKHFDVLIDTSFLTEEEALSKVIEYIGARVSHALLLK